jgi:transcriptional regulator with XRE-family HTH domain
MNVETDKETDYAKLIRAAREKLGLTGRPMVGERRRIEVFAEKLGVSPKTINDYEQGRYAPSKSVLLLLEQVLAAHEKKRG